MLLILLLSCFDASFAENDKLYCESGCMAMGAEKDAVRYGRHEAGTLLCECYISDDVLGTFLRNKPNAQLEDE